MQKKNKTQMENTCAIIIAAGFSSRMGDFKPLLEISGEPAIKKLIHANKDAGVENIIVVTGHKSELLESAIKDESVITVHNPDFKKGMFTSIQAGFRMALSINDIQSYLLFLVDVPLVPSEIINKVVSYYDGDSFCVPCYEGKKGHPLLIPAKYAEEVINHSGEGGLKAITNKYEDKLIRIETGEEAVVLDMDSPEDYRELLQYFESEKMNPSFPKRNFVEETGFTGKIFLARHGSTRLHKEKIFMGQVDVPLSDVGRGEVHEFAENLVKQNPNTQIIYSSPLLRAMESAEIINSQFAINSREKEIVKKPEFMEMNLGDWDGKFINDVKKEFPQEYEKRGKNRLTYKRDPDGENYYDLKYRVIKELKRIATNTAKDEDIIIVTHKGVINVIRERLLGLEPVEAIKYNPPKGSVMVIDSKDIK